MLAGGRGGEGERGTSCWRPAREGARAEPPRGLALPGGALSVSDKMAAAAAAAAAAPLLPRAAPAAAAAAARRSGGPARRH